MSIKLKYDPLHHQKTDNFIWLLIMLVLLVVVPGVADIFDRIDLLLNICYSLVILVGMYIVTDTPVKLLIGLVLGGCAFVLLWIGGTKMPSWSPFGVARGLFSILFFTYLGLNLIHSICAEGRVTLNKVYGIVAGFMLLGIIGGNLFLILEVMVPGSLHFITSPAIYDYFYFSFVILTSIGFGDILPVSQLAKSLSIILGIAGQIYLTIIVAILIGKYLHDSLVHSSRNSSQP